MREITAWHKENDSNDSEPHGRHPRLSTQPCRRGLVEDPGDLVGDGLEECGGKLGGHRGGEGSGDGLGLVGAGGEQHDRPRSQDRGDAHGQGLRDDVLHAVEIAGGVGARDGVQLGEAGREPERLRDRQVARFVESDVTIAADPQELEIQTAIGLDPAVVLGGVGGHEPRGHRPVEHVARWGAMSTWLKR